MSSAIHDDERCHDLASFSRVTGEVHRWRGNLLIITVVMLRRTRPGYHRQQRSRRKRHYFNRQPHKDPSWVTIRMAEMGVHCEKQTVRSFQCIVVLYGLALICMRLCWSHRSWVRNICAHWKNPSIPAWRIRAPLKSGACGCHLKIHESSPPQRQLLTAACAQGTLSWGNYRCHWDRRCADRECLAAPVHLRRPAEVVADLHQLDVEWQRHWSCVHVRPRRLDPDQHREVGGSRWRQVLSSLRPRQDGRAALLHRRRADPHGHHPPTESPRMRTGGLGRSSLSISRLRPARRTALRTSRQHLFRQAACDRSQKVPTFLVAFSSDFARHCTPISKWTGRSHLLWSQSEVLHLTSDADPVEIDTHQTDSKMVIRVCESHLSADKTVLKASVDVRGSCTNGRELT